MADISLHVDGEVESGSYKGSCLYMELRSGSSRDTLYLHGDKASMRAFAEQILAATGAKKAEAA